MTGYCWGIFKIDLVKTIFQVVLPHKMTWSWLKHPPEEGLHSSKIRKETCSPLWNSDKEDSLRSAKEQVTRHGNPRYMIHSDKEETWLCSSRETKGVPRRLWALVVSWVDICGSTEHHKFQRTSVIKTADKTAAFDGPPSSPSSSCSLGLERELWCLSLFVVFIRSRLTYFLTPSSIPREFIGFCRRPHVKATIYIHPYR